MSSGTSEESRKTQQKGLFLSAVSASSGFYLFSYNLLSLSLGVFSAQ